MAAKATLCPEEQAVSESDLSEIEMCPEMINTATFSDFIEKSLKSESQDKTSLNTTQDSSNEELSGKFALNFVSAPALDTTDSEMCGDSESEDLEVSLHSLGLDFV